MDPEGIFSNIYLGFTNLSELFSIVNLNQLAIVNSTKQNQVGIG